LKLIPKRKRIVSGLASLQDIINNGDTNTTTNITTGSKEAGIVYVIDGGGVAITTGVKGYLSLPFDCVITAGELLADVSGSIVVDIWKDTIASFPPTDADSITGATPLTISGGLIDYDSVLTGWTKTLEKGRNLAFNVDSCATVTRCTVTLYVTKTGDT